MKPRNKPPGENETNKHGITYRIGHRVMMRATDDEAAVWPLDQRREWWSHLHPVILYLQARDEVLSGAGRYAALSDFADWISNNTGHTYASECDALELPHERAAGGPIGLRVAEANYFIEEARRRR